MTKLVGKVKSLLHQHPCRECRWLKLDVDTKDATLLQKLHDSLRGANIICAVETRGGYHVILERGPRCRQLYELVKIVNAGVKHEDQWITVENNSGPMLAIPGTCQGGFGVVDATDTWRQAV